MGNRQARKKGKSNKRQKLIVIVSLTVILLTVSGILAQEVLKQQQKKKPADIALTTTSFNANAPSKEYFYAGNKLIATEEPTANSFGDNAEFVSWTFNSPYSPPHQIGDYAFVIPDVDYRVEITMKNTGTTTWNRNTHKLRIANPADNSIWNPNVSPYPNGVNTVAPGASVTFDFMTKHIAVNATQLNFQWQMKLEGGAFFGEPTPIREVCGECAFHPSGPVDIASFVSQTVPTFMFVGQASNVSITMNNSGTMTWTAASGYKLGSQIPQNNTFWGTTRVALPGTVAPDANATFNFPVTAPSMVGDYTFHWQMVQDGGIGYFGYVTPPTTVLVTSKAALGYLDYDNNVTADLVYYKSSVDTNNWVVDTNLDGSVNNYFSFGVSQNCNPVPADYNGDGQADLAYTTTTGNNWAIDYNRDGTADLSIACGTSTDIPVPQDYNGDTQTDIALFRPSTGQWFIDTNRDGTADNTLTFGTSGDIPYPADYNGDAKADVAVFRPSTGQWFIDTNQDGTVDINIGFGTSGDLPQAMDYNKDGKADIAVFRPSGGEWFIDTNQDGNVDISATFGISGDIPIAGDYNGDHQTDIAVYRSSQKKWYIDTDLNSVADHTVTYSQIGSVFPVRQNGWIFRKMGLTSL
jgi:hypothetical protein